MIAKASRKKTILALVIIATAAIAGTLIAYPTFAARPQTAQQSQTSMQLTAQNFTFNNENWKNFDEFLNINSASIKANNITATSKGWAFQRIDNETIKQYAVTLNVTLELGSKKNCKISIINVTGSVTVSSTTFNEVYQINSGKGLIETSKGAALIKAQGVDAQNNTVTLKAEVDYLWWGGNVYAFRGKAILSTTENPMLLLLRYGVAKVQ